MEMGMILPFDYVEQFFRFLSDDSINVDLTKVLIPFVIVAYVLGHLFSYLSSITIEYFTNRVYYYPSKYLLEDTTGDKIWKRYWKSDSEHKSFKFILLLVIFVILLPIDIFIFSSDLIRDFVTRKLDDYLASNIKDKIKYLSEELKFEGKQTDRYDAHRVVMHYVYLNLPNSNRKADNYVALYGFLRSTTLILTLFTDWLIIHGAVSVIRNFNCEINRPSVVLIISLWLLSFISYMGFVKFYRRFTLENFMSLLTGKWHTLSN